MPPVSAGLLMYRIKNGELEIFLAHPGGPLFQNKDDGHWTIPKGESSMAGEPLLETARREFEEETGIKPSGPFIDLGSIRQKGGKIVYGWAFQGGCDDSQPIRSNTFDMQWPPGSGRIQSFPEVDKARFFPLSEGKKKLKDAQWPLIERLVAVLGNG
jgi:predicted NUDIX family NTP pyrophosphohydrolase